MPNQVVVTDGPQSADDVLDSYVDEILGETPEDEPASEPDKVEASNDEESEGEPETQEPEETQEAEEETPEYITLRDDGKEVQLTYDEVIEKAQMGLGFHRKMNELAEQRKTVETQAQQMQQQMQLQSALIEDIASIKALDKQLENYSQVNWNAYFDQDPVEANKAYIAFQQLQNSRQQAVGELSNKQQYISQQNAAKQQQMLERGIAELKASIRDWTPERGAQLQQVGVETYGFTPDEMKNVVDPRMVRVLNDAAKWRDLQSKKPAINKKVAEAPKNVKSGATPKVDEKTQRAETFKKLAQAKSRKGREAIAGSLLDRFV